MKILLYIISLFICFIPQSIAAQQKQSTDSAYMVLLWAKANKYIEVNKADSAKIYATTAYNYSLTNRFKYGKAHSLFILGKINQQSEQYTIALQNFLQSMYEFENLNDSLSAFKLYYEIGNLYADWELYDKAMEYYSDGLKTAPAATSLTDLAQCNAHMAEAFWGINKLDSAVFYHTKNLNYYLSTSDTAAILHSLGKISDIEIELKNFSNALTSQEQCLGINQLLNDSVKIVTANNNIGFLHKLLGNKEKSFDYFTEALNYNTNNQLSAAIQVNMGVTRQTMGQYSEAFQHLNQALSIRKKEGVEAQIIGTQNMIARLYMHTNDLANAGLYATKAATRAKATNDKKNLQTSYLILSDVYEGMGDYAKALKFYRLFVEVFGAQEDLDDEKKEEVLYRKFTIERNEKNMKLHLADAEIQDLAFNQLQLENEKRENELSLLRKEKELNSAKLQQEALAKKAALRELLLAKQALDTKQKDQQIQVLNKDKKIQQIELQRVEAEEKQKQKAIELLEQQKKMQDLEIKEQKNKRNFMYFLLLLVVGILVIITFGYKKIRAANSGLIDKNHEIAAQRDNIAEQNSKLEYAHTEISKQHQKISKQHGLIKSKNINITASINYASNIQTAMLPELAIIQKSLPETFIMYLPKDIVSGDFYWYAEKNGKQIIAAVDCTGHGVPGAFMSLLGSSLLNQTVLIQNITDPGEILANMNTAVQDFLNQREINMMYGMDMSLCVIDNQKQTLSFAGARNPLVYFQKNGFNKIKGTRRSIGGELRTKDRVFNTSVISIAEPTMVYIYSDGYQDQIGGAKERKYMTNHFDSFLDKIHEKPIEEQQNMLVSEFITWHKPLLQIDDVLVIGFKCGGS